MKKISLVICFILIFVSFSSLPAQAGRNGRYQWVWDGAGYVWRKLGDTSTPVMRNTSAGIVTTIAGIGLTEKGYKHYLKCMKGRELGVSDSEKYDHTFIQKLCAQTAKKYN